jgi:hypothetical protein
MAELGGQSAVVKISGVAVPMVGQATNTTDNKKYTITLASRQVLSRLGNHVVKVAGVPTAEAHILNRLEGSVTFEVANPARGAVTIDGEYIPMTSVVTAHEYKLGRAVNIMEVPRFGDVYKRKLPGIKFAYGTLSHWDPVDTYFSDALLAEEPVVIETRGSAASAPRRVWALFESDELQAAVENPQKAIVSFISTEEYL